MKTAEVIIGANFGDEGKGLLTDYYAAKAGGDAVVVRFNGGAQAGHTVTTPAGERHVFSHFSSGSFAFAETHLSRYFVCNPLLFMKERALLAKKCAIPPITVDVYAPVTTPYDMMINQIAEESRGDGRHGSCGMGFGETIERGLNPPYGLVYGDLLDRTKLKSKLASIRDEWLPARLKSLGIRALPEVWRERVASPGILDKFIQDTEAFLEAAMPAPAAFLAETRRKIIFEGAQGLLLDQDRGWFPHVTRSHTGLRNVITLAGNAGLEALNVTYITRAYATRHGAGPLPHEIPHLPHPRVSDETNVHNDYQGTLRFGWLDSDLLSSSIRQDIAANDSGIKVTPGLAVTCLDQLDGEATVVQEGKPQEFATHALPQALKAAVGAKYLLTSRGPARTAVEEA